MKKLLSIILAVLMIVTTIPMAFAADVVASGNCGANGGNVKWSFDSDGTLTISGTGDMADYPQYSKVPWNNYRSDVKKLIIEDGVTSIGENTGYVLTYTTSIYIGKDVKSISGKVRHALDSARLETITVSEDNEYYKTVDNVLFSKDGKDLLYAANKGLSDTYTVPDGVVKINEQAFDFLPNLEKVVLSDSVEEIGDWNFYECKSLKILDVGMAKISSFGDNIFANIHTSVEVIADKDNEYVSVVNGSLFSKIDGTLFYAYVTDNKCVVPYGVKIIPESTIDVEDGSVVVPDTVETIEDHGINGFDSVVHYLGTESQFQEICEGDMSYFEWFNVSMHYCVQQSNIPASCTDDGVTEWYCSTCDETIKYVTGYAFGHDIVKVDAKAPTCTEIGWDAYEYCTACDYSTYVELPAITHIDANCDYKCDYNCGYVYETLDFSDAKILTINDEGVLCIDGVAVVCKNLGYNVIEQYIPDGKYKLASDISTLYYNTLFHTDAGSNVEIDLNGYTWSAKKFVLYVQGSLSIYDTSAENTGKIISTDTNGGILTYNGAREINLYNGTLENIDISVYRDNCVVNLYGGKIKCDTNALICHMEYSSIINIYDTVLETSDGVAHIDASIYNKDVAKAVINVADYSGDGLTIDAWIDITGKFKLLEGIENAEEAEKYTVNYCSEFENCFLEKTEYDETTGELYVYVVANAFTQQPSAENGYTVDFNNSNATFQWYEAEKIVLTPDNVTAIDEVIFENEKWLHGGWYVELFTVDVEAGDMITVSTTSARSFDLNVHTEDYSIEEYVRATGKASVTIDSDAEVIVGIDVDVPNETTEFEIELIKISEIDETETDKTLQNPECGKTYVCKTSVGENVYLSDVVTVGHNIVSVDAKAPTCTEIGWDAYEYCTACTYTTYVELPADPDAHTPLEAVKENEVAPKCDVAGSYDLVVYCDDCGAELDRDTKTVDALKHSFTKYEVTEEAKCGVEGKEVATCDNGCGATDEKTIDALRHSFTKYEVTEEAKCGVAGKEVATCDNGCGATDEKAIEALTHKDADGDYKCDNGCGHEFEKPVTPDEPTPDAPDEPTDNACDHLCHKTGILGFFWKIVKFFSKLFKLNPVCECGAAHY